ncbi:unnamed protein product, partial [Dibothriocephalus latus]
MDDWTNDGNNWRQRWTRVNLTSHGGSSICLQPVVPSKKRTPWLSESANNEDATSVSITARLWSPVIPARLGMRCLGLQYSMRLGKVSSTMVPKRIPWLSEDSEEETAAGTLIQARLWSPKIPAKLVETAQLNCTFDSPCGWHSDANDWDEARWRTVKLQGTTDATNNMATCFVKPKWLTKEKLAARLWSPSIGRPRLSASEAADEIIPLERPVI